MSEKSSIEWTDSTWNPVTGCTKVSPGCKHCYAETFAERFRGVPGHPYEQGFDLRIWPDRLALPLEWKKPRMVFVNSMSDLFHEAVPEDFIHRVFEVMGKASTHTFQVLTKRADRLSGMAREIEWHPNVWMGVSVESAAYVWRSDRLRTVPAAVRFLSVEPLLGPLDELNLERIDWVIVGGESGAGARPMDPDWARSLRDRCVAAGVPFFFKQWGGVRKKKAGRMLDDRTWDEMPGLGSPAPEWRGLRRPSGGVSGARVAVDRAGGARASCDEVGKRATRGYGTEAARGLRQPFRPFRPLGERRRPAACGERRCEDDGLGRRDEEVGAVTLGRNAGPVRGGGRSDWPHVPFGYRTRTQGR